MKESNSSTFSSNFSVSSSGSQRSAGKIDHGSAGAYFVSLILTAIPASAIILIIVSGNCMVIIAVLRDKRLKDQLQNWLLVSLAVSDLFVGLVIMPITLSYEILDYWPLGEKLCELWLASDVLFVTASILNLCAISLDRYWSLTNPIYYATRRTAKRILSMIGFVWVASFLVCCPLVVGWRPMTPDEPDQCLLSHDLGYVLYSSCGSFFIPVVTLLFVYARIYRITRQRARRNMKRSRRRQEMLQNCDQSAADNTSGQASIPSGVSVAIIRGALVKVAFSVAAVNHAEDSSILSYQYDLPWVRIVQQKGKLQPTLSSPDSSAPKSKITRNKFSSFSGFSVEATTGDSAAVNRQPTDIIASQRLPFNIHKQMGRRRRIIKRRERQATYLLGLIVFAFVICWMPFFCLYLVRAACCQSPDWLFDIIFWLGYCNSALNPFIYNFFNPEFRQAFSRILISRKHKGMSCC